MLRRKGKVYQTVMRILHTQTPSPTHSYPSNVAAIPSTTRQIGTSASISVSNAGSLGLSGFGGRSIASTRMQSPPSHHHESYYHRQFRQHQHQKNNIHQRPSSTNFSTPCILQYQHRHSKSFSVKRSAHASTYDPELAACMDRWIKVVFSGQRRSQSSLAKPLHSSTASAYTVVDMSDGVSNCSPLDETFISEQPETQQQKKRQRRRKRVSLFIRRRLKTTLSAEDSTMLLADFRKLMDDIPHEDHALPKAFRPVGAIKRNEKPVLSLESSEKIEDLWRDYCALSSFLESQACLPGGSELARFSRQDYTRLMRIFCHSLKPDEAATRILTIQCDLQNRGIKLTRKLYGMVAQANIISGSIPESTRLYHEAAVMLEPGSLEHKLLLLTLIDTFVANRCASEGIAFLDQVPLFDPKIEDPVRYMHSLYRKLYLYKSREELKQGPKSPLPEDLALIKEFLARPIPPQSPYIRRTLSQLEEFNNDNTILPGVKDPIHIFSKSVSGMILKCSKKGAQSVTPILRSLLQRGHLEEATRVLDMTLQYSEVPDMDQLRFSLLRLLNTDVEKKRLMSIIVQWDAITAMRSNNISSERSLIQPPIEEPQSNRWGKEYSKFIQICIQRDYLEGAINAATYMSKRGWVAQGLDFKKLNSFMVNLGQSSDYTSYIEVRYALGGSVAPDLHSFRRLIYAACRRSDLFSAVSLFHIARTRHLDWTFDSSFYNAIISTAGVIGEVRVAEKTFAQLLKDGVEPDLISFHGLLNGYGQAKDLEAAIMIPKQMRKHNLNPTTKTFNLVMKAYLVGRKDMTTSRKLFKVMQLSGVGGVPPDLVTFNQLLEGYRRVGNTTWFDAYFDRYFGSRHDVTDEKPTFIRPEKPDDWTLLIQLKHSLYLPGIDLLTVQELWHTMKPKLLSQSLPISPPANPNDPEGPFSFVDSTDDANDDPSTVSEAVTNLEDSLPATHVPFQRRLGDVFVPATDRDYFRFTTLSLFRSIFEKHGDNAGVKTIDTILAEFFPTHPMGREVHYRRLIKKSRHLTKLKKRAEVIQQTKEEKKKKRLIEGKKRKRKSGRER